jgi:16S rRNA (guanine966-N2)-methyltransferase
MRIIAGRLRGRPLAAPRGAHTRPTTDRVREALFSILGALDGCRVVDCYAGTGALGLEAVSRGASHATLVENDAAACKIIRRNVEALGVSNEVTLLPLPLERCRAGLAERAPFDLVLSDPPWPVSGPAAVRVASMFSDWVSPSGRVVLGHRAKEPVELGAGANFELIERRQWGDSGLSFYRRRAPSASS